jgi:hypothetical protein
VGWRILAIVLGPSPKVARLDAILMGRTVTEAGPI